MKFVRSLAALGSTVLAASAIAGTAVGATAASPSQTQLAGTAPPPAALTHPEGAVAASSTVSFDLVLALTNPSGAATIAQEVSTPGSALYHHYLTDAQWVVQYAPTQAEVNAAEAWLTSQGFTLGTVPSTRLFVPATGTAQQVEAAFSTTLGYYLLNGETVQMAAGALSIPSSLSGVVSGTVGINQYFATPDLADNPGGQASATPGQEPAPPAGFRNPQPCSAYWGQLKDTTDSGSLYAPYTSPLPYDICGYTPAQLRGAYGLSAVSNSDNGSGVAIAIVDAYDSPTILSDAQKYFFSNDPANPLKSSQFTDMPPASVDQEAVCGGSGWFAEQALDVESSHSMAPGAHIIFVGAQDCFDNNLLAALQTAIMSGASVVSDSWGDTLGDLLTDAATKTAFDDTFLVADATGVSVLFSSGDFGDNFAVSGIAAPDYPASSPFITAVGGTSLEVSKSDTRSAEYGWSTGRQVLCASTTTNCGSATSPAGALAYQVGGGGGTSYYYTQPYYQAGVVPPALALRNQALFGPVPLRVEPDISMDADAQTGMLIGLTQTFPTGVHYSQFKEGGTSLASPLLAGVIADTDEVAGVSEGFLNPTLYQAYTEHPGAFRDIVPPVNPNATAVIRVDYANTINAGNGYVVSLRVITYEGPETYCDGTGNCATRNVTLTTAPGFDAITGLGSVSSSFVNTIAKF
ncbi:MAG TPA: S53 family peptidase [Candidatus Binatia bacterium]|nr:S53 family peptidase [Candidatus Binatia bacterium]